MISGFCTDLRTGPRAERGSTELACVLEGASALRVSLSAHIRHQNNFSTAFGGVGLTWAFAEFTCPP